MQDVPCSDMDDAAIDKAVLLKDIKALLSGIVSDADG